MEQKYSGERDIDIRDLCRLCLTKTPTMQSLYTTGPANENITLFEKLQQLSTEPLSMNEDYPSYLCLKCVCTLNLAYLLMEQIKTSHQQLKRHFQNVNRRRHRSVTPIDNGESNSQLDSLRLTSDSSVCEKDDNCGETNVHSLEHAPFEFENQKDRVSLGFRNNRKVLTLAFNEQLSDENGPHIKEMITDKWPTFLQTPEIIVDISKKRRTTTEKDVKSEACFRSKLRHTRKSVSKICRTTCKLRRHNHRCHQQIKCNICGKFCLSLKTLTQHVHLKHKDMLFECRKCMQKFKSSCTFKSHMNEHALYDLCKNENSKTEVQEAHTDKKLLDKKIIKTQSTEWKAMQNDCNRSNQQQNDGEVTDNARKEQETKDNTSLNKDSEIIRIAEDDRSARDERDNTIDNKTNTKDRDRTYIAGRLKPHSCEQCDKKFSTKVKLYQHMMLHKKESNICDVCGVGFVSTIRLEIHRLKYSGPTACPFCKQTFLNSRYLNMHEQLMHPPNNT